MGTLTVLEVAQLLKIGENRVRELANAGELPAFRVGRSWGFIESQMMEWLEQLVAEQTAQRQNRPAEQPATLLKRSRGRQRKPLPSLDFVA